MQLIYKYIPETLRKQASEKLNFKLGNLIMKLNSIARYSQSD